MRIIKQIFSWGEVLYYLTPLLLGVVICMDYRENRESLRDIRIVNQWQQEQIDRQARWINMLEKTLDKQEFDRQAADQQIHFPLGKEK